MVDISFVPETGNFRLVAKQRFSLPRAELFPFFSDAKNLERITPSFLGFKVVSPDPIEMAEGTRIAYRLSLHGLPLGWESEIQEWNPPECFVDNQTRGPYKLWHHQHRFADTDFGCEMTDTVNYRVFGGKLVNRYFVEKELRKIFAHRRRALVLVFGEEPQ